MSRTLVGLAVACVCLASVADDAGAVRLQVRGTDFILDGKKTFLLGASYYAGLGASDADLQRDLADLRRYGFNWIRVWATWAAYGKDVSAVNPDGSAREPYMGRLKRLVAEANRRGIVVDVTLSRGSGLPTQAAHLKAVELIARELRGFRNVYLDLANERNIRGARYVPFEDLRELLRAAKRVNPDLVITASHAGDVSKDELREYLNTVGVDFIAVHRPRRKSSSEETEAKTREYLAAMKELGREVPVHYQEPFRRGYPYKGGVPTVEDFLTDLRGAVMGGAAGWCLHNGGKRDRPDERPRASFDLTEGRLFDQLDEVEKQVIRRAAETAARASRGAPAPVRRD
ncbi:MAG: hypothetical protein ACUVTZ_01100 [Armatimonadota bacterium]